MEAENERLMSDHGKVIAEMQQSYAKERIHADQVQRQVPQQALASASCILL